MGVFQKESKEDYDFYINYLVSLTKNIDKPNEKDANEVYKKASEEIINNRIKYCLKIEKNFVLNYDIINNLKIIFND